MAKERASKTKARKEIARTQRKTSAPKKKVKPCGLDRPRKNAVRPPPVSTNDGDDEHDFVMEIVDTDDVVIIDAPEQSGPLLPQDFPASDGRFEPLQPVGLPDSSVFEPFPGPLKLETSVPTGPALPEQLRDPRKPLGSQVVKPEGTVDSQKQLNGSQKCFGPQAPIESKPMPTVKPEPHNQFLPDMTMYPSIIPNPVRSAPVYLPDAPAKLVDWTDDHVFRWLNMFPNKSILFLERIENVKEMKMDGSTLETIVDSYAEKNKDMKQYIRDTFEISVNDYTKIELKLVTLENNYRRTFHPI